VRSFGVAPAARHLSRALDRVRYLLLLAPVLLVTSAALGGNEPSKLPREFANLRLRMDTAEFDRLTGIRVGGTCASCVQDQATDDLPPAFADKILDEAAPGLLTNQPMQVYFYRGKLQSLLIHLADRREAALAMLKTKYGLPAKTSHHAARGMCLATDRYLWRDKTTEIRLESAGTENDQMLSLSFGDRRLNAQAEAHDAPGEDIDCGS
jgi:hypothetical protein